MIDRELRALIYRQFRDTGAAPSVSECAASLAVDVPEVKAALRRLAESHTIVLRPDSLDVWMAHPFSGIPTDFKVHVGERSWFANCGWDALAILSLLGDGWFETVDPITGSAVRWDVNDGQIRPEGVVHFAVPARQFWDDIGFT